MGFSSGERDQSYSYKENRKPGKAGEDRSIPTTSLLLPPATRHPSRGERVGGPHDLANHCSVWHAEESSPRPHTVCIATRGGESWNGAMRCSHWTGVTLRPYKVPSSAPSQEREDVDLRIAR